nr:flagellin [uncultured Acetatifactor sp.]
MVVQHNLTAMNSNRMLGLTTKTQAKATEKLSSGYKINRAADDAAGLAISEKMRKQIRGLTQASANAQDGISAVQTAEGALTEVHDMLQRMNELAVKAANGTQSKSDREAIQSEINQLVTEIDRVSITTKFNETYLLKGNNNGEVGKLTYTVAGNALGSSAAGTASNIFVSSVKGVNGSTGVLKAGMSEIKNVAVSVSGVMSTETSKAVNANNNTAATKTDLTASKYDQDVVNKINNSTSISGRYISVNHGSEQVNYVVIESTAAGGNNGYTGTDYASVNDVVSALNQAGKEAAGAANYATADTTIKAFASMDEMMAALKNDFGTDIKAISSYITSVDDDGQDTENTNETWLKVEAFADLNSAVDLSLHVGADSTAENKINMNIAMMSARGLGINGLKVNGDDSSNADAAINTIAAALQKVSNQRSSLGAIQNRLEHTINNLDNVVENTQSAESAIRDTDMATQMVTYSNNQILAQAGQAMLAQSNQANQGVLSLLG